MFLLYCTKSADFRVCIVTAKVQIQYNLDQFENPAITNYYCNGEEVKGLGYAF